MNLPTVYRPSKRAEDQEEGLVGAPDTWPVRQEGGRYCIVPDILKSIEKYDKRKNYSPV
jgi:hypothetical protein